MYKLNKIRKKNSLQTVAKLRLKVHFIKLTANLTSLL